MHSSRMCTAQDRDTRDRDPPGHVTYGACWERNLLPSPCEQNGWQTPVKILSCQPVKMRSIFKTYRGCDKWFLGAHKKYYNTFALCQHWSIDPHSFSIMKTLYITNWALLVVIYCAYRWVSWFWIDMRIWWPIKVSLNYREKPSSYLSYLSTRSIYEWVSFISQIIFSFHLFTRNI